MPGAFNKLRLGVYMIMTPRKIALQMFDGSTKEFTGCFLWENDKGELEIRRPFSSEIDAVIEATY